MTYSELNSLQSLPTTTKVAWAKEKIQEWYEHFNGAVYVAFSGGKDSTVLLHIVRYMYPDVPAVFVDTGLEFPEIREFVKSIDNVTWIKPKMGFGEVLKKYGYPIISKEVSMAISRYRNTKSDVQRSLRLHGGLNPNTNRMQTVGVIPKKYHYLLESEFNISERCCDVMKKAPFKRYDKETERKAMIGTMATDSRARKRAYLSNGCNNFEGKLQTSTPMAIWKEEDIWNCLRAGIPYSNIYDLGYDRTGCVFCMFGCQAEKESRFERLAKTHPQLHSYCMSKLGLRDVLEFMDLPTGCETMKEDRKEGVAG